MVKNAWWFEWVDGRLDERKNRRTDGYTEMEISGGDRGQI